MPPFFDPLSEMTSLQLAAPAMSMAMGYYRSPRRVSTGEMAAALGVPRTTFQLGGGQRRPNGWRSLHPRFSTEPNSAPQRDGAAKEAADLGLRFFGVLLRLHQERPDNDQDNQDRWEIVEPLR
ncbi:MAG: helix-turn-helix domain-containing protein [Nitrososphaerota archaeon]|nr:helix-turn-helix domain-containing protein [Nitrososphaerota archaeon]MDG7014265.1 helix-turn-helix domain-containing protein [Nitrososphaerota archaeon]MDG7026433.1 helix-turn-helix domain-containing protein [Nitrososphaerota archaeon]